MSIIATRESPWVNSLGMKFVPVPGTEVLFSIWQTRVADYELFASVTRRDWQRVHFPQGPTHPPVRVRKVDAEEFCAWLPTKELREGGLPEDQHYCLPADWEWSVAAGLEGTPEGAEVFPWGTGHWPPDNFANYGEILACDNFKYTSPVGSFPPNQAGLFDLGGNVEEWCEDRHSSDLARGLSWDFPERLQPDEVRFGIITPMLDALAPWHQTYRTGTRGDTIGFRAVLASKAASL